MVGRTGQTYFNPLLIRAGKLRFFHLFGDTGMHSNLWKHVAPTWKGRYDCLGLSVKEPPTPVPRGGERWDPEETWSQGWQKQTMLRRILAKRPHDARQDRLVWEQWRRLKLPPVDRDFIQRVLWRKLQLGGRICRLYPEEKFCPIDHRKETHLHFLRGLTSSVMFDLVRQSFGVVQAKDDSVVEPNRLVVDAPLLSLGTTQGLLGGVARTVGPALCHEVSGGGTLKRDFYCQVTFSLSLLAATARDLHFPA